MARFGHGVIQVDTEFIVVGGGRWKKEDPKKDEPTESCKLNGQLMICATREPSLTRFAFYPELVMNL